MLVCIPKFGLHNEYFSSKLLPKEGVITPQSHDKPLGLWCEQEQS